MKYRNDLKRRVLAGLFAGAALYTGMAVHAAGPAADIIANDTLPQGHEVISGNINIQGPDRFNNRPVMVITQTGQNGVIKWDSFNVGANAAVTFDGNTQGFNTLNYVTGEHGMSQIYGAIDATNGGNIYIVNPAGVEIGSSAQINVGSLYVSNKNISDTVLNAVNEQTNITDLIKAQTANANPDAVLMSLGNVNASNVTFDGARIVIDTENLRNTDGHTKLTAGDITVRTTDADSVILGYDAYDEIFEEDDQLNTYKGKDKNISDLATVYDKEGNQVTDRKGYMWIDDVEQLQAVNTNLGGNYALRSSIDATATRTWNDEGTENTNGMLEGFRPIGMDEKGNVMESHVETEDGEKTYYGFYGKFDGLGNHIFDLTINRAGQDKVGLFGTVHDASISNVNLVSGSITGGKQVGGLIGAALGTTQVAGVTTGADVAGSFDVGGVIGYAGDFSQSNGTYQEEKGNGTFTDLVNTGAVKGGQTGDAQSESDGNNVGGLIGYLYGGSLGGDSYNLGNVTTSGHNAGGLVGRAKSATLGDGKELIYNRLTVTGAYNVGGIVGNMESSTVQNAENSGNVAATGYTEEMYQYHTDHLPTDKDNNGLAEAWVHVANAGGIAGRADKSTLTKVENQGDVSSGTGTETGTTTVDDNTYTTEYTYYTAGNVGGIVGRAENTNIIDAENLETTIRGAHNVGGIAGYFGSTEAKEDGTPYQILRSVNDGGDIMGTGARYEDEFVEETVRTDGTESFVIGNLGGIAGYMDGDDVQIYGTTNRGTVETWDENFSPEGIPSANALAANAGGIVGKIDRSETLDLEAVKENPKMAAVYDSYNTGDVRGYTGVGGIAGMMYNGEIAWSYNLGHISTTRQASETSDSVEALNMGGIVGDTTEQGTQRRGATVLLYDVYNKGQIGDETYTYFGRHVGGIAGRLSGTVYKAYNTGAIYNRSNVVGGIVGYMYRGRIENAFNTGNITVYNTNSATSQVGGIVGTADLSFADVTLQNIYNLGTLRSFQGAGGQNSLGGIIGSVVNYNSNLVKDLHINNAYTTGNLYAAHQEGDQFIPDNIGSSPVQSIWGQNATNVSNVNNVIYLSNVFYIRPAEGLSFSDLSTTNDNVTALDYDQKDNKDAYEGFVFAKQEGFSVSDDGVWRWYDNSTPILNVFLPNTETYFSKQEDSALTEAGIGSIQYGTAYDPLLTIIHATENATDLSFDWKELGMNNAAGLAVYGAGLTLNGFQSTGGTNHFSGLLYSDGVLSIAAGSDDVLLGSASQLYGSAVQIETDGTVTAFGSIHATANVKDGTSGSTTEKYYTKEEGEIKPGDVSITGGEVNLYGTVNAAVNGEDVPVYGIGSMAEAFDPGPVNDPHTAMDSIGGRFSYVTHTDKDTSGDISIAAEIKEGSTATGDVNLYYGEEGKGLITTNSDLTVTAAGDIYSDSDLHVGGNITFDAPGEKVLDLTNIGKVRGETLMKDITAALQQAGIVISNPAEVEGNESNAITAIKDMLSRKYDMEGDSAETVAATIVETLTTAGEGVDVLAERVNVNRLHEFLDHFQKPAEGEDGFKLTFKNGENGSAADSSKITVDMWDYDDNQFNLDQFDLPEEVSGAHKGDFVDKISGLNLSVAGDEGDTENVPRKYTYIWVADGDQLAGIQQYYQQKIGAGEKTNILEYNFALKNDIDASQVQGYESIGAGVGYNGIFDGRDNRIMGLVVGQAPGETEEGTMHAGLFDTIGADGVVKDVNIYSGRFTATQRAGAVAAVNNGTIEDVSLFSNRVEAFGSRTGGAQIGEGQYVGAAGGVAGVNTGAVSDIHAAGIILAGEAGQEIEVAAGGLAGINSGTLSGSRVQSAVTADSKYTYALGGAAGVNMGNGSIDRVHSFGTVSGVYLHNHGQGNGDGEKAAYSDQIGGIAGVNQDTATISNVYNAGRVSGRNDVGGIAGVNTSTGEVTVTIENGTEPDTTIDTESSIYNAVNSADIHGAADSSDAENSTSNHVGGLVGSNEGHITNGRNNGRVTGNQYVGGLVGENGAGSVLKDLVNDSSAFIEGDRYVGGIAGSNAGEITVSTLDDDGQPAGNENAYLVNRGTITGQQYVGGVAGVNTGTIANTNNSVTLYVKDKTAQGENAPQYFGGVVGWNKADEETGKTGTITNATNRADVEADGASHVGGIVGKNDGILEDLAGNYGNVIGKDYVGGVAGENTQKLENVTATNQGHVEATDGGAGGIFGVNGGVISGAHLTNEGNVTGTMTDTEGDETGTGGIFGINHSHITDSILENLTGDVTINRENGQIVQNVGGLMGINTGDVSTSSLKNEANITVTAGNGQTVENIGGLIGQNTGTITGGRTDTVNGQTVDYGYYKYQIYNNGTITVEGTGSNIGGLIGTNEAGATVTAGYNTGVINAGGSDNVGGIAGTNAGTLYQVFNTVITGVNGDGSTAYGSISGGTNVGGIAGANSGTIKDAYNTTAVTGSTSGSIAGTNDDTISNVYGSVDGVLVNSEAKLVGSNTGSISNIYTGSENGFGENGSQIDTDGKGPIETIPWRQYGTNNPILKVFLTQLTITDAGDMVYNGYDQNLNLSELIHGEKPAITGPEGMENPFAAYDNTLKPGDDNDYGDSELLYNVGEQIHAGTYQNWLASEQISAGKNDTVNNLGYDIAYQNENVGTVGKAQISITLDDVNRTYGDKDFTNGTQYGYEYSIVNGDKVATDVMKEKLDTYLTFTQKTDGAVDDTAGKETNDANGANENYTWTAEFGFAENSNLSQDYEFVTDGNSMGNTVTVSGNSHVDRANITITAGSETIYAGGTPNYTGTNINNVLVNGDKIDVGYWYGPASGTDTTKGHYVGIHFQNGTYYGEPVQGADWFEEWSGFGNYNVTFIPGQITFMDWPSDVVQPPVDEHWNFLFDDNPWDRNRDFRERKANIHFIAGGMTL